MLTKIVLFDTETTGLPITPVETQPPEIQPYIIELSAVMIEHDDKDHVVVERLHTRIAGAPYISKRITDINGIAMEDLVGQPLWFDVREHFFDMCNKAGYVCAHNLQFDARMIQLEEQRLGFGKPFSGVKRRCSLSMSRKVNDAPSHNLGKLYKHLFGKELVNAHTADADTNALVEVYMHMVKKGAWSNGNTPGEAGA